MSAQKVAFVCLHGSAKSLIAAEYFNRIAIERNLPLRATTSGPEPDTNVPENVVAGLKPRHRCRAVPPPTLIAADQLADTGVIVSFACGRSAPSKPEERWDECPLRQLRFRQERTKAALRRRRRPDSRAARSRRRLRAPPASPTTAQANATS
jgi:arsenate reductase (thioredoxin)